LSKELADKEDECQYANLQKWIRMESKLAKRTLFIFNFIYMAP